MNNDAVASPSLNKVATALREITERLAFELAQPTGEPLPWNEFEWRIAMAVAAMQGVSSLLCAALPGSGPASWQQFLNDQRQHVAGRYTRIAQLLNRIDSEARGEGVALVALKGAALHLKRVYEPGERPMADLDLLVRECDVQAANLLLKKVGYEMTFATWRHQLFESRSKISPASVGLGEHINNPIKIELHTSIRERLPISETDITEFLHPRGWRPGLNDYPSLASLMMHLLLHAAGNMRAHALRLIQLHDIARLAARLGADDWEDLLTARPNGSGLWWAAAPLTLTARYCPDAIPPQVIARLNLKCPWLLGKIVRGQCLADVSWSNIRVYALPGVEWSRSPHEAMRFIISRVWPSREARGELQRFTVHHPGASKVPWYGISQSERIVRWLFSSPPRVQTVLSVRAALAKRDDELNKGVSA